MPQHRYITDRQEADWNDLHRAIGRSVNGQWSIECDGLLYFILRAARATEPTPPGAVPWPMLASGAYELITGVSAAEEVATHTAAMACHFETDYDPGTIAAIIEAVPRLRARIEQEEAAAESPVD